MKFVRVIFVSTLTTAAVLGLIVGGWLIREWSYERGLQAPLQSDQFLPETILNRSSSDDLRTGEKTGPSTVLLVTFDTTRADHLSTYGYARETSPNLTDFAGEAVRFDRAFASMATTAPSHATMMTGLYPLQHRLMKNGQKMRGDVVTLAQLLRDEGYRTAAFVSTDRHFGTSGVARGFQTYNDPSPEQQVVTRRSGTPARLDYRPGRRTLDRALKWIKDHRDDEKVFLWVHFFDPHTRYVIREQYAKRVAANSPSVERWTTFVERNHHLKLEPAGTRVAASPKIPGVSNYRAYDAEIRYMDAAFGDLLAGVRKYRDGDRMSLVVGDHGEGLGNHGWWGHGKHLYNEQVRVPMIVRFPKGRYGGRTVDTVVETNDLMATVLRAVNPDTQTLNQRNHPIEGQPLQFLLEGRGSEFGYAFQQRRMYAPFDTRQYLVYRLKEFKQDLLGLRTGLRREINRESGRKYALVSGRYKYIYSTTKADQFYDLKRDFYEQTNRLEQSPVRAGTLATRLLGLVDYLERTTSAKTRAVDPETRRKLEGLGYVQ